MPRQVELRIARLHGDLSHHAEDHYLTPLTFCCAPHALTLLHPKVTVHAAKASLTGQVRQLAAEAPGPDIETDTDTGTHPDPDRRRLAPSPRKAEPQLARQSGLT